MPTPRAVPSDTAPMTGEPAAINTPPPSAHAAASARRGVGGREAVTTSAQYRRSDTTLATPALTIAMAGCHPAGMAVALAPRLRALWLVCLLALTPASPLGLALSGHEADADLHGSTTVGVVHDAADHGIAPEALPEAAADTHCLYCQTASSLRLGWSESRTSLADPALVVVEWPDAPDAALRVRMRLGLPARAPPPA